MGMPTFNQPNTEPYYQGYRPAASYQANPYFSGQFTYPQQPAQPAQQPMYQPSIGPKGGMGGGYQQPMYQPMYQPSVGPKGGMGGGYQQPMYQPQPQSHISYMQQAPQYNPAPQQLAAPTYTSSPIGMPSVGPKGGMGLGPFAIMPSGIR